MRLAGILRIKASVFKRSPCRFLVLDTLKTPRGSLLHSSVPCTCPLLLALRSPHSRSAPRPKAHRPVASPQQAMQSLIGSPPTPGLGGPFVWLDPFTKQVACTCVAQYPAISLITPSFQRVFNLPEGVSLAYPGNMCRYDN